MDKKYRELLESCDEDGAYEFPRNFDYCVLERDALLIEGKLQSQLQLKTKFEDSIYNQDASFSIAIILLDYTKEESRTVYQSTIRFSNFGRLCTFTMTDLIPIDILSKISGILETGGFHYIPEKILDVKYDGIMSGNKALPTWWIRYFDWL